MVEEVAVEGGGGDRFGGGGAVGGYEGGYGGGVAVGHTVLGEAGEDHFHEFTDHGEFGEEGGVGRVGGVKSRGEV